MGSGQGRGWGETTTTTLHKEDVHGEIKRNTIISLQGMTTKIKGVSVEEFCKLQTYIPNCSLIV